jgi:hypothetical protein
VEKATKSVCLIIGGKERLGQVEEELKPKHENREIP